jgi:hypothetical protein
LIRRLLVAVIALGLGSTGCSNLLGEERAVASRFSSFESARDAFVQIEPGRTTADEVRALRFDPADRGAEIMPHTQVMSFFFPHRGKTVEMLPEGMRTCFEAGARCKAWLVSQGRRKNDRIAGFWADFLGFHRLRHITGWEFRGAIMFVDDRVVYALWGGDPRKDQLHETRKPLGPIQSGPKLKVRVISSRPLVLHMEEEGEQQ